MRSHQQACAVEAGLEVAPVSGNARVAGRHGLRQGRLAGREVAGREHPLQRVEAAHPGRPGDGRREGHLGLVVEPGHPQCAHVVEAGVVVFGFGLGRLAQGVKRVRAAGLGQRQLVDFLLGFQLRWWQVFVEELTNLPLRQSPHEAVHRLPVLEQDAGRDAADAEGPRQLLLLVGVDLDQLEAAGIGHLKLFQQGPDDLAGATPGRPEVHQHRHGLGGGNDLGFKVFDGDVNHWGASVCGLKISPFFHRDGKQA